jgi:hypothetical protein
MPGSRGSISGCTLSSTLPTSSRYTASVCTLSSDIQALASRRELSVFHGRKHVRMKAGASFERRPGGGVVGMRANATRSFQAGAQRQQRIGLKQWMVAQPMSHRL